VRNPTMFSLIVERIGLYIERAILTIQIAWLKSELELIDRQLGKLGAK